MKGILERWIREKGFWWYGFCQFLSIVFFLLFFRYRVFGREHVPSKGPVLIASNHQSFFDPVLVGLGLGRQIHIMAREGLFRIPGFAALIRSLNAFPLKRGAFDRSRGVSSLAPPPETVRDVPPDPGGLRQTPTVETRAPRGVRDATGGTVGRLDERRRTSEPMKRSSGGFGPSRASGR
ncbi:MAG: lysophospholipid acyltransferase family protein [Planctomycetota bacterium]